MSLDLLAFSAPLMGVLIFFLAEQLLLKDNNAVKHRAKAILSIEALNLMLSLLLSAAVLVPLVFLLAPLQLFSFSNIKLPQPMSFMISFLFLDCINYLQHRLHHKIPFLWRLHRLHHSDRHMDALTTLLHHPLEIMTGFLFTVSLAVIFDIPVIVMITYALISGLHSSFTHFRQLVPVHIEKYLKYALITPNFHRIHHSIDVKEGNSNFGGVFIFWDMLLSTLCLKNDADLMNMKLGVDSKQHSDKVELFSFIKNPFI